MLTEVRKDEVVISEEEYNRLLKIEKLLRAIESDLPSGLDSWVTDEELEELFRD